MNTNTKTEIDQLREAALEAEYDAAVQAALIPGADPQARVEATLLARTLVALRARREAVAARGRYTRRVAEDLARGSSDLAEPARSYLAREQ